MENFIFCAVLLNRKSKKKLPYFLAEKSGLSCNQYTSYTDSTISFNLRGVEDTDIKSSCLHMFYNISIFYTAIRKFTFNKFILNLLPLLGLQLCDKSPSFFGQYYRVIYRNFT